MEAGRELDVLVAEKVFGWFRYKNTWRTPSSRTERLHEFPNRPEMYFGSGEEVPHYSTDIAAAWQVKQEITKSGEWGFVLHNDGNGWSEAIFRHAEKVFPAEGNTDEVAICLAALKAVGYKKEQDAKD